MPELVENRKSTNEMYGSFTSFCVNTIATKRGSNALVCCIAPDYLCIQKLIDVQQTLISNPNIH